MRTNDADLAPAGQRDEAEGSSTLAGPVARGETLTTGLGNSPQTLEAGASRQPPGEKNTTRAVAQAVVSWYARWRANETHPFTIPQEGLRALVSAIEQEIL